MATVAEVNMFIARYLALAVEDIEYGEANLLSSAEMAQRYGRSAVQFDRATNAAPPIVFLDYPEGGTVDEVIAWVGDDRRKATYAQGQEHESGSPRTTLLSALYAIT